MADDMWGSVPDDLDFAAVEMARERAQSYKLQSDQLRLNGRTVEANIAYQKAQVELRKVELAQQKYLTERGQQIQAAGLLVNARGPGNAAQFISLGRRLSTFEPMSGGLLNIAEGKMPQGAFVPGSGGKPVSMEERMSGMLGAPSQDAIDQRDRNDRALATRIFSSPNRTARGSLQALSPYERDYLKSYGEDAGFDWDAFTDAYQRAGIQQGRRG